MMMVSANDAAYSVAHTVGGSLDALRGRPERDSRTGSAPQNSILGDPAGLDDTTSFKGGPYTSAYDLAIAARNALDACPPSRSWAGDARSTSSPTRRAGTTTSSTTTRCCSSRGPYFYFGATGFKTGFTEHAQHTFVGTAMRNGRTLIVVIMGAVDAGYAEAKALLDAGFAAAPDRDLRRGRSDAAARPRCRCTRRVRATATRSPSSALAPAGASAGRAANVASDVPASIQLARPPRAAAPVAAPQDVDAQQFGAALVAQRADRRDPARRAPRSSCAVAR